MTSVDVLAGDDAELIPEDQATTRALLGECGTLARQLLDVEEQAKRLRARRLVVWRTLLDRGVKAGDIEQADGTVTRMAVRDAIRQWRKRRDQVAAASARTRRPRPV